MPGKYQGWDIKMPNGIVPAKFIMGFKETPDALMDLDPRRTGEGLLIRNVLPYVATTIEITLVPMSMSEKMEAQKYFPPSSYIKAPVTYWNEKYNDYFTGDFYIPEPTWERYVDCYSEPIYIATTIQLIGYGEKR